MELTELHAKFELIIYNGLVRGVNTEKYINKYIHTYIHKANHFNTGPTTSSRHSKNININTHIQFAGQYPHSVYCTSHSDMLMTPYNVVDDPLQWD